MSLLTPWSGLAVAALSSLAACQGADLLIIGHRGSPYEAIENSLESFEIAYMQGADGVELDVQYTKDDLAVVMHDETLDRTTNCTGAVRERTLADLASCQLENGEPVQPVEELLPDLARWFSIVFLEIKVPEVTALSDAEKLAFTDVVARVVRASGLAQKIVVISYDQTVLEHLATWQDRGIVAGWDTFDDSSVGRARRWRMAWSLMPVATVSTTSGAIANGLGQSLAVYQVNTPQQFLEAEDAQVTAIMADSIPTICSMLGKKPRERPTKQ